MVRIRLQRVGAKKKPYYRLVVADARSSRSGLVIENIGHYDPRTDPPTLVVEEERALAWLSQGAQPTEAVASIFAREGVLKRFQASKAAAKPSAGPQTMAVDSPTP